MTVRRQQRDGGGGGGNRPTMPRRSVEEHRNGSDTHVAAHKQKKTSHTHTQDHSPEISPNHRLFKRSSDRRSNSTSTDLADRVGFGRRRAGFRDAIHACLKKRCSSVSSRNPRKKALSESGFGRCVCLCVRAEAGAFSIQPLGGWLCRGAAGIVALWRSSCCSTYLIKYS